MCNEAGAAQTRFSIECVVVGRNDDYEPNWAKKLEAAIQWNKNLFDGSTVDFTVAFVEWNPPKGKPLLSPGLVERYPFLRAIVVESDVHQELCQVPDLSIMLNFSFNAAMRTTAADYLLITGGDDFIGSSLANKIIDEGLRPGCLYRAERVNVRRDLSFATIDGAILEDPQNIVSIDTCSEPPFNEPPYTNASGDFLLLDSGTMAGLRGLDESIKHARLHIDSRFCTTAMAVVNDCHLLGRIFHIDHGSSYKNRPNVPGKRYKWDSGLPYVNAPDWGLARYHWRVDGNRLLFVGVTSASETGTVVIPDSLSPIASERAATVSATLARIRAAIQPETPERSPDSTTPIDLTRIYTQSDWGSVVRRLDEGVELQTGPVQWSFAGLIPIDPDGLLSSDDWHWLMLRLAVHRGELGVSLVEGFAIEGERFLAESSPIDVVIPIPAKSRNVMIRNTAAAGTSSKATLHAARIISYSKKQRADEP